MHDAKSDGHSALLGARVVAAARTAVAFDATAAIAHRAEVAQAAGRTEATEELFLQAAVSEGSCGLSRMLVAGVLTGDGGVEARRFTAVLPRRLGLLRGDARDGRRQPGTDKP